MEGNVPGFYWLEIIFVVASNWSHLNVLQFCSLPYLCDFCAGVPAEESLWVLLVLLFVRLLCKCRHWTVQDDHKLNKWVSATVPHGWQGWRGRHVQHVGHAWPSIRQHYHHLGSVSFDNEIRRNTQVFCRRTPSLDYVLIVVHEQKVVHISHISRGVVTWRPRSCHTHVSHSPPPALFNFQIFI